MAQEHVVDIHQLGDANHATGVCRKCVWSVSADLLTVEKLSDLHEESVESMTEVSR